VTLLGMELHGKDISPCDRASKRRRIIGGGRGQFRPRRHRIVAVRKIETGFIGNAMPQRVRAPLPDRTPAHVRDLEPAAIAIEHRSLAEPHDPTRQHTQASRRPLLAVVEQHLQSEADAEEGAIRQRLEHDVAQAALVQTAHAVRHRALPWQHHPGRAADYRGIGGDFDGPARRDVCQRLGHRAQVSHSVIDDGDVGHRVSGIRYQGSEGRDQKKALHPGRPTASDP